MKYLILIFRNMRRNWLPSLLASGATMVLVLVVTMVWSILAFLDKATAEKSQNLKAIITERWQIPSQMPYSYAQTLSEGAAREPDDARPLDAMTWSFYGGTLDLKNRTMDNVLFAFALEPKKLRTMMDELDSLPAEQAKELDAAVARLEQNRIGVIVGRDRLKSLGKQVGDRLKFFGINYKGIDLEVEIVGLFPPGRYDKSAAINRDYLAEALEVYKRNNKGQPHPLAEKSLNLVWLRLPDTATFQRVADQIENSPYYSSPTVKCETAASGVATFIDSFRDIIAGMRYILSPAALISISLIIANAISIGVRQRRMEIAVMKVLGFRPGQILLLVLGESLLLGFVSGTVSAWAAWWLVNNVIGGIPFPIAFFPSFFIDDNALWWGPLLGAGAAFLGSAWPAASACVVKVTDVFSKVT
jgi:putative ABC transport system permease protein